MNSFDSEVEYRRATVEDVPAIMSSRGADPHWGPADARTAAYLQGTHHPQKALPPRALFVAVVDKDVAGYIAGHLTERYDCDGELQYLWVAPDHRRRGVALNLFRMLTGWFHDHRAKSICVDVEPENVVARSFYSKCGAEELNSHWLIWQDVASTG